MSETLIFQSGHRWTKRIDGEVCIHGAGPDLCADMAVEIESLRARLAAAEREREQAVERTRQEILAYCESEIERLMEQAEHWEEKGKPLAVHHRLHKADAYFQIVVAISQDHLFREIQAGTRQRKQAEIRYPPGVDLAQYRDVRFVAQQLAQQAGGA